MTLNKRKKTLSLEDSTRTKSSDKLMNFFDYHVKQQKQHCLFIYVYYLFKAYLFNFSEAVEEQFSYFKPIFKVLVRENNPKHLVKIESVRREVLS
ncbi:hypothetical protein ACROYT_G041597 [Oculina patagonica]